GRRELRAKPILLVFVAIAMSAGASSEGFDRLWEAHILKSFDLPSLGGLPPVAWFGVMNAGALVVGLGAVQLAKRIDLLDHRLVARRLFLAQAVWLIAVISFG